jgi:hypothetical protein
MDRLGANRLAFGMAPFGYWVGFGWVVAALVPPALGAVLVYSARVSRKWSEPKALEGGPHDPYLPPGHELRASWWPCFES